MAYEQDYYKKLQEEDYKSLLKSEMQLDAARQRAMKNTQTQLEAQGMGSAGFGSTARAGIEGQYQQGLQNAQENYVDQVNYHQEQADSASASEMQDYLTQLSIYQNDNDGLYNRLMQDEYGNYDEQGNWVWNEEKLSTLNPKDAEMLKSGVTALDYTNNTSNSQIVGNFILNQIEQMNPNDFNYAQNLYAVLKSSGVITEKTNDNGEVIRELDLSKVDKQTALYIEQLANRYDLLSGKYNGQAVDTSDYFAMATQVGTSDPNYYNYMSMGYYDMFTSNWETKGFSGGSGDRFRIYVDGTKYVVHSGDQANGTTKNTLNKIYKDKGNGTVVYYKDKLYVKGNNGNWFEVKKHGSNSGYENLLKKLKELYNNKDK